MRSTPQLRADIQGILELKPDDLVEKLCAHAVAVRNEALHRGYEMGFSHRIQREVEALAYADFLNSKVAWEPPELENMVFTPGSPEEERKSIAMTHASLAQLEENSKAVLDFISGIRSGFLVLPIVNAAPNQPQPTESKAT